MLPTKRELGKWGGRGGSSRTDNTDAETNPQVDTGASSLSDDRGSSPVDATNELARESGSHGTKRAHTARRSDDQLIKYSLVILDHQKGYGDCLEYTRNVKEIEWSTEIIATRIPEAEAYPPASDVSSEHGNEVSVGYVRNFLPLNCVSPSEWAMVEFRKRLLRAYDDGDSLADVAARFH
ncbi:hypothetical protein T11_13679 [Trichinella zimbabwensis]|uniref:Uncharacterized protein n=1 Tax=Trichinella zimbabwensis TaxID=268475 RepID=A0A0V1HCK7_9BILA|nr:hypothetical protein T11_13679 [Trichinella zimbabwensis]